MVYYCLIELGKTIYEVLKRLEKTWSITEWRFKPTSKAPGRKRKGMIFRYNFFGYELHPRLQLSCFKTC